MHRLSFLFVALGVLGTVAAQSSNQAPGHGIDTTDATARMQTLSPSPTAEPGLVTDVGADGTLWVAATTWKACFATTGTTFVPCFGASAPRNFPAHLGRPVVRVAGEPLASDAATPAFGDGLAEYRGRTFTERYLLQDAGIEQQFVFAALPTRGAIEVTVPFSTELEVTADAGSFRIVGAHGTYQVGRAFAMDAAGRRLELATEWTGTGFRIAVPAAFVAEARLPLVIDPLIGNVTAYANDTRVIVATDMAWDESMNRYALVHERVYSATDSDIYVRYLDGAMQFASNTLAVDISLDSWRNPHIAGLEAYDTFLVVAERSIGNAAPFSGRARLVQGNAPTLPVAFAVLSPVVDVRHVDVGGDPSPIGPASFCIVGEQEYSPSDHDIHFEARNAAGNLVNNGTVEGSNSHEFSPRIGKSCGAPGGGTEGWGIAYLRDLGNGQNQPLFRCLSRNFGFSTPSVPLPITTPAALNSVAVSSPTDDAQGRQYAVQTQYDSGNSEFGRAYVYDRAGTQVAHSGVFGSGTPVAGEARIDCDGTRFVIANYHRNVGSPYPYVSIGLYGIEGSLLSYEESAPTSTLNDLAPCVVAHRSGGGGDRSFGLAWVELLSPTTSRVVCSNYDGYQAGVQLATRNTSCGGLGFLSGGQSVLGGTVSMQLVPNPGLLGWVVGMPVDVPLGFCPGCRQGADGTVVLGASYAFVVPRNAAFVGVTVAFQGFQFTPSAGAGACLGQINLSNTLDATLR